MQETIQVKQSNQGVIWLIGYMIVLVLSGFVLWSAIDSAPVIWQAEAEIGHSLTCIEAYDYREISNMLYIEHRAASDLLYLFFLFSPVWPLLFGVFTFAFFRKASLPKRIRWITIATGLALVGAILLYLPAIRLITCATE